MEHTVENKLEINELLSTEVSESKIYCIKAKYNNCIKAKSRNRFRKYMFAKIEAISAQKRLSQELILIKIMSKN